jgi:hypothetical protein
VLHDGFSFFLFDGFEQDRDAVHMFLGPLYDFTDNAFAVENVDIFIRLLACSNSCTAASLRAPVFHCVTSLGRGSEELWLARRQVVLRRLLDQPLAAGYLAQLFA